MQDLNQYQVRNISYIRIYIMFNYDWRVNKETGENGIVLLEGPYKDIIFTFKKSKVILKNEDGSPLDLENAEEIPIDFQYEVLYNPEDRDVLTLDFKNAIGDIFMEILYDSVKNDSYRLTDEDRNDDTEQSNS